MFNETLYRETFSRLRASDEAKKEVLQKMNEINNRKRLPKVLRTGLIAAVLVAALAVTANAASGGMLLDEIFHEFTIVWSDGFHDIMVDEDGNKMDAYNVSTETEVRDGRLILMAMGQEEDITDDLESSGEAVRTFERDGFDMTVTVTGTVEEHHIITSSESLGVVYSEAQYVPDAPDADFAVKNKTGVFVIEDGEDAGSAEVPFVTETTVIQD